MMGSAKDMYLIMLSKFGLKRILTKEQLEYCACNINSVRSTITEGLRIRYRQDGIKGIEQEVSDYLESLPDTLRIIFLAQQSMSTLGYIVDHTKFDKVIKEISASMKRKG